MLIRRTYKCLRRLYDRLMASYLDGPRCYARRQHGEGYRSPALASFWWLLACGTRFFSLPALFVLPWAGIFLLHSIMLPEARLRQLIVILLALLCCDLLLGWLFRPRLRIKRSLPERACAGQPFVIRYQLQNLRRLPALNLLLDPGLGLQHLHCTQPAAVNMLSGKENRSVEAVYSIRRRGKYYIGRCGAQSDFPFVISRHYSGKKTNEYLLVHPKRHKLLELKLPSSLKYQRGDLQRVMKVSEAMEFQGCRDFQDGDNPRYIHWQSSAKKGSLVVREFQDEFMSRSALILDSNLKRGVKKFSLRRLLAQVWNFFKGEGHLWPEGSVPELEAALSLCASIADFLLQGECLIDLLVAGKQVRRLRLGRGGAALDSLLDCLAQIEPERKPALQELSEELLQEISELGSAIVILLGYDRLRQDFVKKLQNRGVAIKLLVIGSGWELPEEAQLLEAADILAGRVDRI
ncbi:MAG: DUF58 domain-containing protein [Lentisphaeria bacterium]|nr:DUF58 domain-containing protein [Lentisphaeria bacterium]